MLCLMSDDDVPAWTLAEKIAAGLGIILAAGLLLVCADVMTGGRLLKLCGCNGTEPAESEAADASAVA